MIGLPITDVCCCRASPLLLERAGESTSKMRAGEAGAGPSQRSSFIRLRTVNASPHICVTKNSCATITDKFSLSV